MKKSLEIRSVRKSFGSNEVLKGISFQIEPGENKVFIKVKNADLAMSQVLELFAPPSPVFHVEIHPTTVINATATIGKGSKIITDKHG